MIKILFFILIIQSAYSDCEKYKALEDKNALPSPDKNCKSFHLYYGTKGLVNYGAAVKCAYRELQANDDFPLSGATILMMSYAGGKGVTPDKNLALKYACLMKSPAAESEPRIKLLEKLEGPSIDYEVCDEGNAPSLEGHCVYINYLRDQTDRAKRLEKITGTFGVDSQAAFKKLEGSLAAFKKIRVKSEVNLSASDRGKMAILVSDEIERTFMDMLERYEKNGTPHASIESENYLNGVIQKVKTKLPIGTIKSEGVDATQRAWTKYKEAWIEFARARYPKMDRMFLTRELTDIRIKQLEDLRDN